MDFQKRCAFSHDNPSVSTYSSTAQLPSRRTSFPYAHIALLIRPLKNSTTPSSNRLSKESGRMCISISRPTTLHQTRPSGAYLVHSRSSMHIRVNTIQDLPMSSIPPTTAVSSISVETQVRRVSTTWHGDDHQPFQSIADTTTTRLSMCSWLKLSSTPCEYCRRQRYASRRPLLQRASPSEATLHSNIYTGFLGISPHAESISSNDA